MNTAPHSGLSSARIDPQYRTGERDPVDGFYRPCLEASIEYSRAVGYFRSSILAIIGPPLLAFARRKGSMRLVCSPSLTEGDVRAMSAGYVQREAMLEDAIRKDLDELLNIPDLADTAKLLATLIKTGVLEVRLAFRTGSIGIYHEKLGIFRDEYGEQVSFLGSANETWNAWHPTGNHESIEVFRTWVSPSEAERVRSHATHFERLWCGQVAGIETVPFPSAQTRRLIDFAGSTTLESLVLTGPPTKTGRSLLAFQTAAVDAWQAAGSRGILQHATGSGKTITALEALRRHLTVGPAVVLVPSQLLLHQWKAEIEAELPHAVVLLAGAGNVKWKDVARLRAHTHAGIDAARIVLATMHTAASDKFLENIQGGNHLLLVADEVHQIGSRVISRAMSIQSGGTLGLSATPERYGDPDGTAKVFDRFGPIIKPIITLQDAIREKRLVEYEYFPHTINLSEPEEHDWRSLTREIGVEVARTNKPSAPQIMLSERAKMLLIQRSRIAKKAAAKPGLAAQVIRQHYQAGQKWLVYCEDIEQVGETRRALKSAGLDATEYHSAMVGDRAGTLDWFRTYGGVLISIKCLDEGVDIPAVSHAFILASSQNPRQFIQRRGRVLRRTPEKHIAVIHDVIVAPVDDSGEDIQASLLKAELARAIEFASSAINADAGAELRSLALRNGLNISQLAGVGIEEEEEGE